MGFSFVLCMFRLCLQGPTEKDQIDVQGDIMYDLAEFITETWQNVPESAIYYIEDGRKVPAMG
jgi:hypothetical protein